MNFLKKAEKDFDETVIDFVKPYFEGVNDYPEAMSAYQEIENLTPAEILEKVGNPSFNPIEFRKYVINKAYRIMWRFYTSF